MNTMSVSAENILNKPNYLKVITYFLHRSRNKCISLALVEPFIISTIEGVNISKVIWTALMKPGC